MSVNKAILIGNCGSDPEVRTLESGVTVAKVNIATSETYKNKAGEKVTDTEWHTLIFWRKLAEIVEQYVKKGQTLYVEGKIVHRTHEADGVKKYYTEIVCNNMTMLGGKGSNSSEQSAPAEPSSNGGDMPDDDDGLPF